MLLVSPQQKQPAIELLFLDVPNTRFPRLTDERTGGVEPAYSGTAKDTFLEANPFVFTTHPSTPAQ